MSSPECAERTGRQLPIYVISGSHSHARREAVSAHLREQGLDFEFVPAVFPEDTQAQLAWQAHEGAMSPGEVCCVLSHQEAMRRIIASDQPCGLILEDDARPEPALACFLALLANTSLSFDVLLLGRSKLSATDFRHAETYFPIKTRHQLGAFRIGHVHKLRRSGAVALVVSRAACARLLQLNTPVTAVMDDWPHFVADIDIMQVMPLLVFEDHVRFGSDLEAGRKGVIFSEPAFSWRRHAGRLVRSCWLRLQLLFRP